MTEMIIPGTYISVRAEGLISAGRIATGIVGVIGTAASGPVGQPVTLAGFGDARDLFGLPDDYNRPEDGTHPLTLVRALEQIYNNGASTVMAVRVAGASHSNATYAVRDADGNAVATLTARTPGTWGNDMQVRVDPAETDCRIEGETYTETFDRLTYTRVVPSAENQIRIFRGINKRTETLDIVYQRIVADEEVVRRADDRFLLAGTPVEEVADINLVRVVDSSGATVREYGDGRILYGAGNPPATDEIRINPTTGEITFEAAQVPLAGQRVMATYAVGHAEPGSGQVRVTVWDGRLDFAAGEAPQTADGDRMLATYLVDRDDCVQVTLEYGVLAERYTVPDGRLLAWRVNQSSALASAEADATNGAERPASEISAYFGTGSNTPGNNGAEAGPDEYAAGLEQIANELVNIVVLAGQDATTAGSVLLGHLNTTAQTNHERIGVIGAGGTTLPEVLGHTMASDRVILVSPGMTYPDGTSVPAAYTAAAVAGLLASVSVQTSLTNQVLNVPGLATVYNQGQQGQLINRNVLTIIRKEGFRILKGVTTSGVGTPFSAIPTRRIVDYAKYGVRSASNPYIGRLNNARVRAALKATLDAFLTRMVEDEALTGYELEVSATRAQEIAGEVSVVMTIQPTFSIDFIKVTMILR